MQPDRNNEAERFSGNKKPYDLTEEASKRGTGEGATEAARSAESDDVNEETNLGFVSSPEGDSAGENRVTTSISDD